MRDRHRIERALDVIAGLIEAGEEWLIPIFERFERELEQCAREESALDRARRRVRLAA